MHQRIGKLAPNHRAELGEAFGGAQAIQPGHEGIVQRDRNGHRLHRPGEFVDLPRPHHLGFENGFGHFLDKERHPIGFLHDLRQDDVGSVFLRDVDAMASPGQAQGDPG